MVNLFTAGSNSSGTLTAGLTAGINDMGQIGYEYVSQVPTNSTAYLYGTAAASGIPLSSLWPTWAAGRSGGHCHR